VRAGEHLVLVWQDARTGHNRVYSTSSSDAGLSWTQPERVDHLPVNAALDAINPAIALVEPGGEVLVAWQDGRNGRSDIFLARSTDGGRTWGKEDKRMDMDEPGTAVSAYPKLAVGKDGRVAIAWDDDRDGAEAVYLRLRSVGVQSEWGPETRVTTPAPKSAARLPQLIWGPDLSLYLAWEVWEEAFGGVGVKRVAGTVVRPDHR
jgi:hypothetical protein